MKNWSPLVLCVSMAKLKLSNQKPEKAFIMFRLIKNSKYPHYSALYDQKTFYKAFIKDLNNCQKNLIIESPFITSKRMKILLPILAKLRHRGVDIIINTRNPAEHDGIYQDQAFEAIYDLQALNITVLYTTGHHRKLAIIDNRIIWEGSLNILSFNDSCEIMRRIVSIVAAKQLLSFTRLNKYL